VDDPGRLRYGLVLDLEGLLEPVEVSMVLPLVQVVFALERDWTHVGNNDAYSGVSEGHVVEGVFGTFSSIFVTEFDECLFLLLVEDLDAGDVATDAVEVEEFVYFDVCWEFVQQDHRGPVDVVVVFLSVGLVGFEHWFDRTYNLETFVFFVVLPVIFCALHGKYV